jgi:hypothetical protein
MATLPRGTRSSRRSLVAVAAAFAGNALIPAPFANAEVEVRDWSLWAVLPHRGDLVALGRHCADGLPELGVLPVACLCRDLAARLTIAPGAGASMVAAALKRQIARDFARGDIAAVGGWQLSLTEILLALIAARTFGDTAKA